MQRLLFRLIVLSLAFACGSARASTLLTPSAGPILPAEPDSKDVQVTSVSAVYGVVDANTQLLQIKGYAANYYPNGVSFQPVEALDMAKANNLFEIDAYFNAAGQLIADDARNKLIVQASYAASTGLDTSVTHTFFLSSTILNMASYLSLQTQKLQFRFDRNQGETSPLMIPKVDLSFSKGFQDGSGTKLAAAPYFTRNGVQSGVIWRDVQTAGYSTGQGNVWAPALPALVGGLALFSIIVALRFVVPGSPAICRWRLSPTR